MIVGTGTEKKLINIIKVIKNITFITIPLPMQNNNMYINMRGRLLCRRLRTLDIRRLKLFMPEHLLFLLNIVGAADMITDGINGILFNEQNVYDINKTLDRVGKLIQ